MVLRARKTDFTYARWRAPAVPRFPERRPLWSARKTRCIFSIAAYSAFVRFIADRSRQFKELEATLMDARFLEGYHARWAVCLGESRID
jgi:hypothetical protein